MKSEMCKFGFTKSRWAAVGAALAVTVGSGGVMTASASVGSGERAVFVPITPCRVMDTRPATQVGPRSAPIAGGETYTIVVRGQNGQCNIPADAVGVVMNVTAVNPTVGSFLTVFPADAPRPNASSLNWVGGQPPVSNGVTADLSADGRLSLYNLGGTVDLAADIVGYFVDHHHDDRYVRRLQTLVFSGLGLNLTGAAQLGTSNGCATHFSGTGEGYVALNLPVGARVLAADVTVYETGGAGYVAQLIRQAIYTNGVSGTPLATANGTGSSLTSVVKPLNLAQPETVDAGESFVIRFDPGGTGFSNGLCQATVTVDLSTSP